MSELRINQIPCKDCITLGICKAEVIKRKSEHCYFPFQTVLNKCSLLEEYLNKNINGRNSLNTGQLYSEAKTEIFNIFKVFPYNILI